jgi:hypothetical protein
MSAKTSIDLGDLQKMIAESIAAALAADKEERKTKGKAAKPGRKPQTDEEKAKNRAKVDAETVKNFEAAGFKDVKPRENVMTYNRWIEHGRRVKKGEKSVKCGSFPLFHIDQTEPLTTQGTVH